MVVRTLRYCIAFITLLFCLPMNVAYATQVGRYGGTTASTRRDPDFTLQDMVTRAVYPRYPPEAKSAGVKGKVVIKLRIDEVGKIESARVMKGNPLLRNAALEAAKGWKFAPPLFKEKRIKYTGTITIHFSEGDS